ncbi:MAG: TRAP transporter small permease [Synergistaceae bacterium]|jgi:TRAP-type C4-dicarboxylate transport system permease small subunit|nr:TRAP transporter small permease [Synergistaceae bacterium]
MSEAARRNLFDRVVVGAFTLVIGVDSLLITLIIVGAAASRYIFKVNFYGYEEIAVLVAFWFYFMGAAYGSYNNTHVTADVVDAYLPEGAVKRALTFARHLVTSSVCGLFVYYGYGFFSFGFVGPLGNFQFKPTSMVWRIPLWTSYSATFVGLIFMEVYFVRNLILSARALVGRGRA